MRSFSRTENLAYTELCSFRNKAVGVLPIDDEGYTYLIGQYRYPLGIYSWKFQKADALRVKTLCAQGKESFWKKQVCRRESGNCCANRIYQTRQQMKKLSFIWPMVYRKEWA